MFRFESSFLWVSDSLSSLVQIQCSTKQRCGINVPKSTNDSNSWSHVTRRVLVTVSMFWRVRASRKLLRSAVCIRWLFFLFCFFAMNKNKGRGVAWVKPAEPSFLKKFKSDVGYKEGPNVDTKVTTRLG